MRRVKTYMEYILEKDGLLGSQAVGTLAKFIDPKEEEKKSKEQIEEENPELSALAGGGWEWSDDEQGYVKISEFLCGKVVCIPGGPYRVLTGPNKGKTGIWSGSGETVEFKLPSKINSASELEGPDEEFVKEYFSGIDYYINLGFITVKYKTDVAPFEMNYYDFWQTYGEVKIEYDMSKRIFKWESTSGPNSSFKGEGILWAGTEEKATAMTWSKGKNRDSKGESILGPGILAPWMMRDKRKLELSPVEFPSLKFGGEKDISKGSNIEYCEDPYHFLYLTMPSGIIKRQDADMFKKQWESLLMTHYGGKDNVKWDNTDKNLKGSFRIEKGINGYDTLLFTLDCKNELPSPGKNVESNGNPILYYGNLGFKFSDNSGQEVTGEWYWDFRDGEIGMVRCSIGNKDVIKLPKADITKEVQKWLTPKPVSQPKTQYQKYTESPYHLHPGKI
jgi:hypothetical protein